MAELLDIVTLGGLRLQRGGAPLADLGSHKAEALLVYLACRREPQPRAALADLLWAGQPAAQTAASLRWALALLHKHLGPYVRITRTVAGLDPGAVCRLDVAEFEALLLAAPPATRGTGGGFISAAAAAALERAVGLYRGPFLHGFPVGSSAEFERWLLGEQTRLQDLLAAALDTLVAFYLARAELHPGIRAARRLLEVDPLREETQRALMQMLAASGARQAALDQFAVYRRLLAAELGVAPAAATRALAEQIATGTLPARPQPARPARVEALPRPLTPFIGRDAELTTLSDYLADPATPLITLTGLGGAGKTRLAGAAAAASEGFPDGVYFVPLAGVPSADLLIPAIAAALNFRGPGAAEPGVELLAYLRDKQLLLMLDNFEHLLSAAQPQPAARNGAGPAPPAVGADWLPALLAAAPAVKLLVTSREPLRLSAEQVVAIGGLAVPPLHGGPDLETYPGVRLFVERAGRRQAGFALTEAVAPWVVQICRLVDGLPLGIEIAAAWVAERDCREIAADLQARLDRLASPLRDVPARHRSLQAVFDESWRLLAPAARTALRRLSIFRGGCTAEAAGAVAGAGLAVLAGLERQALVRADPAGRFDLHDLLRQYSAARLAGAPGDRTATGARHAAYYLALAEAVAPALTGSDQARRLDQLETDHGNLRQALQWALDSGAIASGLRLGIALGRFWDMRGYHSEGRTWLGTLLAHSGAAEAAATRAVALRVAGYLAQNQGDYAAAARLHEEGLVISRALGDQAATAALLLKLGHAALGLVDFPRAQVLYAESLALARALDLLEVRIAVLDGLGDLARLTGDYGRALTYYEEGLALERARGNGGGIATTLQSLGLVAYFQGDSARATRLLDEALDAALEVGDRPRAAGVRLTQAEVARRAGDLGRAAGLHAANLAELVELGAPQAVVFSLEALALVALAQDDCRRGVRLLAAAAAHTASGPPLLPILAERPEDVLLIAATRARLAPATWATAWAAGQQLTIAQAVADAAVIALAEVGEPPVEVVAD